MREQTLLRIALISSILGLAILFVVAQQGELGTTQISKIDSSIKGNQVKIIGTVASARSAGDVQILTITQPSSITVFVSGNSSLRKGDTVEIIGRVDEYREKEEIVADRIRVVHS